MSVQHERREKALFKDLSIIISQLKDPKASQANVTAVKLTNDNSLVKVYVTMLGNEQQKNKMLEALNSAKGYIRRELSNSYQGYRVPELRFEIDQTFENAQRIEDLLKGI